MMDWKQIRQQWQAGTSGSSTGDTIVDVQQRDRSVRAALKRRDWLETSVALIIAPVFAYAAWRGGARGAWWPAFFSLFLALWAAYVPWRLWRARRALPTPQHQLPLLQYLQQERAAMLGQAQMLEQIWSWYLAPCAIGVIGLVIAAQGVTTGSLIYAAIVLGFVAVLARANKYAARTQFRSLAEQIEQQIARLTTENGQ